MKKRGNFFTPVLVRNTLFNMKNLWGEEGKYGKESFIQAEITFASRNYWEGERGKYGRRKHPDFIIKKSFSLSHRNYALVCSLLD